MLPPPATSVPELILETQTSISSFLSTGLVLGLTYCKTANLTRSPEKRQQLLTLALEALTAAERHMKLTPFESHTDLREAANQLRCEISQLELNSLISSEARPQK